MPGHCFGLLCSDQTCLLSGRNLLLAQNHDKKFRILKSLLRNKKMKTLSFCAFDVLFFSLMHISAPCMWHVFSISLFNFFFSFFLWRSEIDCFLFNCFPSDLNLKQSFWFGSRLNCGRKKLCNQNKLNFKLFFFCTNEQNVI